MTKGGVILPRTILHHLIRNKASFACFLGAAFFFLGTNVLPKFSADESELSSSSSDSESDRSFFLDLPLALPSSFASGLNAPCSDATMEYEVTTTCACLSFAGSASREVSFGPHIICLVRPTGGTVAPVMFDDSKADGHFLDFGCPLADEGYRTNDPVAMFQNT